MRIFLIKPNRWDPQDFFCAATAFCLVYSVLGLVLVCLEICSIVLTGFCLFVVLFFFNCCKIHGWSNLEEIYWAHSLIEQSVVARRWSWELLPIVAQGTCLHSAVQEVGAQVSASKLTLSASIWFKHPSLPRCPSHYGAGCFSCKTWGLKVNILVRV